MEKKIAYPLGIQTFEEIRKDDYLYIDKTELIYELVNQNKYVFLSRPRRFGKSLLLSTIQAYFEGRKELFEGLAISEFETEWKQHPVIRIDFTGASYESKDKLLDNLDISLSKYETLYGLENSSNLSMSSRFTLIIEKAYNVSNKTKVVILIDEYDKPLQDSLHDDQLNESHRTELQGFYSVLKKCDEYIRFGLLTGVGKFGHVSIFSGLNNLTDISMEREFNSICGISESEFREYFPESVRQFAAANDMTEDEVWDRFRKTYDGYHFSKAKEGIYNPFSVLQAFRKKEFGEYWFRTGTPSFLTKVLKEIDYPLPELEGCMESASDLSDISNPRQNIVAMLFQTGYLTIKGYDEDWDEYELGYPNEEVRKGFTQYLYKYYVLPENKGTGSFDMRAFVTELNEGKAEEFMLRLQSFIADITPGQETKKEIHFQNNLYVIFRMLGLRVAVEIPSAAGRSDMEVKTDGYVYIFEFKINSMAEAALEQIKEKGYADPYKADSREVFLIGANFSTDTGKLETFIIEKL